MAFIPALAPFDIGDPEYTMNGEWEGQPTTFSLTRWKTGPTKELVWFISIEREGEKEESIHFYAAIPFADKLICKLPRQTGWLTYDQRGRDLVLLLPTALNN